MPKRREPVHFHQLSEFEKGQIVGMREAGFSIRQIANRRGRNVSTVLHSWRRLSEKEVHGRIRGSGRPQRTSAREDCLLRIASLRDRHSTTRAIATDWIDALEHRISMSLVDCVYIDHFFASH